jgi:hypothetical protein
MEIKEILAAIPLTASKTKVRGTDYWNAGCVVKNTGNVAVTISSVKIYAWSVSGNRSVTTWGWDNLSITLNPGESRTFWDDSKNTLVPSNADLGDYDAIVEVSFNGTTVRKSYSQLYGIYAWTVSGITVRLESVSVSKTTLNPGESYTLTIYYTVDQGTYYVYLDSMQIGSFTTYGESGSRSYNLTAPSSPGTYTFTVKLQRAYTGETDSKSYTITVKTTAEYRITITKLNPNSDYNFSLYIERTDGKSEVVNVNWSATCGPYVWNGSSTQQTNTTKVYALGLFCSLCPNGTTMTVTVSGSLGSKSASVFAKC